jgi:hypothetical protein
MNMSFTKRGAVEAGQPAPGHEVAEKYDNGYVNELSTEGARAELEAARRATRPVGELP